MNLIKFVDILSGKNVYGYYNQYMNTQWYNEQEIFRYQNEKLRNILFNACETVPYYMKFSRYLNGIDNYLNLLEMFPIINKDIIKNNYKDFISKNKNNIKGVQQIQTGGTTGNPLKLYIDINVRNSTWAAFNRFYNWMGVKYGEPQILIWGGRIVSSKIREYYKYLYKKYIENIHIIDAFKINSNNFNYFKKYFKSIKPVFLRGYCQSIYELAKLFENNGFNYPLKSISTTVEPLFDEYRMLFKKVFNCETFDQYACTEIMSIAFECDQHKGLHITNERVIIEVNDDNELILTDLDNIVFPLIRYKVGDKVIVSNSQCKCGRKGIMFKNILGRSGDVILGKNGRKLHPEFFTHLINELGISYTRNIVKYQVIQQTDNRIVWNYVGEVLNSKNIQKLKNSIKKYLGDIQIDIVRLDNIQNDKSGKFRYVISELNV